MEGLVAEAEPGELEAGKVVGQRFRAKPRTKVRTCKFNVLNDPHAAPVKRTPDSIWSDRSRSYPLQAEPRAHDLKSWQSRCKELIAALTTPPEDIFIDMFPEDVDIQATGTWLPTVSKMIDDAVRRRLLQEGFTEEDWEQDHERTRITMAKRRKLNGSVLPSAKTKSSTAVVTKKPPRDPSDEEEAGEATDDRELQTRLAMALAGSALYRV